MKTVKLPVDLLPATPAVFRAGDVELDFENGDIRQLRLGSTEVIRRIYMAVRDHYWTTADCRIEQQEILRDGHSFAIAYQASYSLNGEPVYAADISITGSEDAVIEFSVKGRALKPLQRNRIGICVHHPLVTCTGRAVSIFSPDKKKTEAVYPQLISPHQPFLNIERMMWEADGMGVEVTFSGDVFESEDQRNWGDACYKTYSTPLAIPFPVQLQPGDTIEQQVVVRLSKGAREAAVSRPTAASVKRRFPKLGYGRSSADQTISPQNMSLLKKVPFDGYRCELHLGNAGWKQALGQFASEASALGTRLDLVVFFDSGTDEEMGSLAGALKETVNIVESLLVLQSGHKVTPKTLINRAYAPLKAACPRLRVGYGTDVYFTELNRYRPDADTSFDFVGFSTNPQVHAADVRSIMENVEALPWIVKTARSFARGREVYVSPLTLRRRHNHDAKGEAALAVEPADERQSTTFAARYALLSLAALSDADKIFMFETTGPGGLIGEQPYPVFDLLQQIHTFGPTAVLVPEDVSWQSEVVLKNESGEQLRFTL